MRESSGSRLATVGLETLIPVLAVLLLAAPAGAKAAVLDIPDGDVASLIAAVNLANTNGEPDTINLAPGGTYLLTAPIPFTNIFGLADVAGLPRITSPITINGRGATIQRSNAAGTPDFRIITTLNADLTLDTLTIRGGRGGYGAGVEKIGGSLRVLNTTITENDGGTEGEGAGIFNRCGSASVLNSTISRNRSFGGFGGGGILNFSHPCAAQITIVNSTIFENRADGPSGFQGRGDALADGFSPPGSIVLKNSIVGSPTQGLGGDCYSVAPALSSLGHNISTDGSCALTGVGDLNGADPLLAPLANNGGPTPTHALLRGSPGIDAVPLDDCTDAGGNRVTTDQRGVVRPEGPHCDIGAYEFEASVTIDIKPGSYPNRINLGSAGVVPVAILGSAAFDATQVDPESVTLAGASVRLIGRGNRYACSREDINGDGFVDLLCHVETAQFMIEPGSTTAKLTASTFAGSQVRGEDSIEIIP